MFRHLERVDKNKVMHTENHGALSPIDGYAVITKIDDEKRVVFGVMTKATLDNQDEIVEWPATVEAVQDFQKWMNLREMHDESKASGVIRSLELDHENKLVKVEAEVVDDEAWKKVKKGVYKGFSIGGKALERVKEFSAELGKVISKVKKYILNEVSLVDRPAHPECLFEIVKRDGHLNDPLYGEMMSAESKVPVFKSKVMTDDDIAKMADHNFGLVKVRRTRNGLYKRRYFCMPDKIHARSVLSVLSNSSLSKRDQFKVHKKAMKVLGKSHRRDMCPYCFELKKYRILSEVNSEMKFTKRQVAEAHELLRQAGVEDREGTTPHDRPVESEDLRGAGRQTMNRNVPASFQDDQEGEYEDYYPEEEYEGEYEGEEGYYPEEEYEGEYEDDPELFEDEEGNVFMEDGEGGYLPVTEEDLEGWDGEQGYEDLGQGGPEEKRTHLYSQPEQTPIDSEDREGEYEYDDRQRYDDEEGIGKSDSCPYCATTMRMASDAAQRGDIAKATVQCPGCNQIYDLSKNVHTSITQRGSRRVRKAARTDIDMELSKRDDMIEQLSLELERTTAMLGQKPKIRKMARISSEDLAEAEKIVKNDEIESNMTKAVTLKKSGQKLTPDEERFCEDALDASLEKKAR